MVKSHSVSHKLLNSALNNKTAILVYCCILLSMLLLFTHYVVGLDRQSHRFHLQERVLAQAGDLRTRLEQQIHTTLNLTMGSLVYVATHPNISQNEFAIFAKEIIQHAPYVLNLGLAKDNVISHIYPQAGNENVLGLRYMDHPQQRDAVLRAIETKKTVIAGPVELIQGGQGFISRIPIFLNDNKESFWGISSIVVKVEPFFKQAGLNEFASTLDIAIRGKDATGEQGDVFYGNPQLFNNSNIVLNIPLPVGSWSLAAAPKHGWSYDYARSTKLYVSGACLSLLFCLLLYSLLYKNIALKREQSNAKIANEHKSRFFTNMTHELRTPLTAIYGSIKLLGSDAIEPGSSTWNELLDNAERNCQRLKWIVNDILDLKKIESGKMTYHTITERILDVINESIDGVKQYAEQFHIPIQINHDPSVELLVNCDRVRLTQVICNLLSNAIKYSPPDKSITIDLKQENDFALVRVFDSGPGIDTSKLDSIFNEFEQVNHSDAGMHKTVASSGLGLSISKQIIQDHNGQIGCYNNKNGGSVFFIKIPLVCNINHDQQPDAVVKANTLESHPFEPKVHQSK